MILPTVKNISPASQTFHTAKGEATLHPGEERNFNLNETQLHRVKLLATAGLLQVAGDAVADADAPERKFVDPADDKAALKTKHKGGGKYSIMRGDEEVKTGLSKDDAETFDDLSDDDKETYVSAAE